MLLAAGCALQKETAINRGLQNLTAHYNILFNANEILRQKQEAYALSFVDSYNEILNVYQDTTSQSSSPDKDLDEAKAKANKIINIKEQSHYIGDAYLVLGKASFLGGDYFSALEYFNYVTRSFPDRADLVQQALFWKARSLMYMNQMPKAKLVIDTAIQSIKPKKKTYLADIYATRLQYDINVQQYVDAEESAKQAIGYCHTKAQRQRWTFILAQIEELNGKNADAIKNYTRVASSNASFEMAFNANLNRIRIEDMANGVKLNRIDRLRALIKNENNKDFIDQVYYQIAELYFANKDIEGAIKNYKLSVRTSKSNQNQKGLSYLRLADIDFKTKADYIGAKKYYDSTLMSLAPNYPGYQSVQKKRDNLQVLADKYGIIAREDTLQMLAQLDEKTRTARIDAMVQKHILQLQAAAAAPAPVTGNSAGTLGGGSPGNSSFYFYNANAVSQGINDFKRQWGNRKLEDNWRRSNKGIVGGSALGATQSVDPDAPSDPFAVTNRSQAPTSAGNYRQQLIKDLPLTPGLLTQSNLRIYNAYFDLANFYRDILGDKKEAIAVYELLLTRFASSNDKAAIYYNLYRLYSDLNNIPKADEYKNLVLKNYPETAFAKTILDPGYGRKLTDADAGLNGLYNQVYETYSKKKFNEAIKSIDSLMNQYPNNKLSPQLAYLRAISSGHLERLAPFREELVQIVNKYPDDRLITPLVKQHLAYIDAHMAEMATYPVALTDNDTGEVPFKQEPTIQDKIAAYNNSQLVRQTAQKRLEPVGQAKKPDSAAMKPPVTAPVQENKPVTTAANPPATHPPAAVIKAKPKPSIFSMSDSTNYYFVVNISTATINPASSRFGIGQFNRTNFQGSAITHQLKDVGEDNQLIYVGRFYSLEDVKAYARTIIPLMPDIMKMPKDKYSFFIITKQNLDKLNNKNLLDSYIEYYQSNY